MTRFYDECDEEGCERPVKKIVADRVANTNERRPTGLCREHKRDRITIWDSEEGFEPDDELPF